MKIIKRDARAAGAAAFGGVGIALAFFGLQPASALAQTYTYSNANGNFSTGFSPKLPASSTTANLAFGGGTYTATDDLNSVVSLNSLQFTNSGVVTLARSAANGASNTLNFDGPSSAVFLGNSTGAVTIALDMSLGLHGINVDGPTTAVTDTFSGVISGTGFVDLLGSASTLALTNLNNTYSGGTVFAGGTISIAGDGSLGATTTNSGQANLDFAGGTLQFIPGETVLNANRNVVLESGGGTISIAINDDTIAGKISGSGNLTLTGGYGVLYLTGTNTYSGNTTIEGNNSLVIGNGGTSGSLGSGSVTDNASLNFERSDNYVVANVIGGSGTLKKYDGGDLSLTGSNSYSGGTTMFGGTLTIDADNNLGAVPSTAATNLTILNGSTLELAADGIDLNANRNLEIDEKGIIQVDSNYKASIDGVIAGNSGIGISGTGGGTVNLNGANTYTGGTVVTGATAGINSDASLGAAPGTAATNVTLNNGTLQDNVNGVLILNANRNIALTGNDTMSAGSGGFLVVEGALSGTGNLSVAGAGQVELDGNNTGTGTTTINAGSTLILGDSGVANGGTAGSVASGNIIDNGGLVFGRTNTYTVANAISGTGVVAQSASGTTVFSSSNSYSGGTYVYYGTLALDAAVADGSGALNVQGANSVVRLDVSNALGSGSVNLSEGGTLVNNAAGGGASGHAVSRPFTPHDSGSGVSFTNLGTLNVGDGTSFLDFGANNTGATFAFSGAGTFTGTLEILNWDDAPGADSGLDELIFGTSASGPSPLTSTQLADIEFVNPDGMTGTYAARQGSDGSLFANATPIGGAAAAPEPGSVALLGLGIAPLMEALRKRRRRTA